MAFQDRNYMCIYLFIEFIDPLKICPLITGFPHSPMLD